jgi:hypothetical protein
MPHKTAKSAVIVAPAVTEGEWPQELLTVTLFRCRTLKTSVPEFLKGPKMLISENERTFSPGDKRESKT